MAKFKVGDRVRIKKGQHWNIDGRMDRLIGVEATISKIYNEYTYSTYELENFSSYEGSTDRTYREDMLDLVEEKTIFKAGDRIEMVQQAASHLGNMLGRKGTIIDRYNLSTFLVEFDGGGVDFFLPERFKKTSNDDVKTILQEQVQKAYNSGLQSFIIDDDQSKEPTLARKRLQELQDNIIHNMIQDSMKEPFFKKFLPFKKDKPMTTLAQEIFDRFLKSNKTKVIEAVERAETIIEEVSPLLKPFNELSLELVDTKKNLEKAFDEQNKEMIKFYLKELQEINSIYDDKLFDQLKTVLKAINKSLSL